MNHDRIAGMNELQCGDRRDRDKATHMIHGPSSASSSYERDTTLAHSRDIKFLPWVL